MSRKLIAAGISFSVSVSVLAVILYIFLYTDLVKLNNTTTTPNTNTDTNPTPNTKNNSDEIPNTVSNTNTSIKPFQEITDFGYIAPGIVAGWFDYQKQGVPHDYCRWVGSNNDIYFACALAGDTNPYTKVDPNNSVFGTNIKPFSVDRWGSCSSTMMCKSGQDLACRIGDNRCLTDGDCAWANSSAKTNRDCTKMVV